MTTKSTKKKFELKIVTLPAEVTDAMVREMEKGYDRRHPAPPSPPPKPGDLVPGQGVYLGRYTPKDRDGNSLRKTFNAFAAPEDLPEIMTYADTVKHIAKLKNWHGHDGTNYATDKEFYHAVKNGSYNGGWIIPTLDLLRGKDADGTATAPDNILAHKGKGLFKGTFEMAAASGSDFPDWYRSSTTGNRDDLSYVWVVRLSDGDEDWDNENGDLMSCRPVRLVAVKT